MNGRVPQTESALLPSRSCLASPKSAKKKQPLNEVKTNYNGKW